MKAKDLHNIPDVQAARDSRKLAIDLERGEGRARQRQPLAGQPQDHDALSGQRSGIRHASSE